MVNQTITITKLGINWGTAHEADQAMRSFAGDATVAFIENAKASNELVSFSAVLVNGDTLRSTREWTDEGWVSFSTRKDDIATMVANLEADGYTIDFDQPAYA